MTNSIGIEYVTDEAGNKSKVLISYEDWQRIEAKLRKWDAYEVRKRKKQAKPNKDEIKKLARQLDASVIPNDITMDEIVEECRVVRKELYERDRKV